MRERRRGQGIYIHLIYTSMKVVAVALILYGCFLSTMIVEVGRHNTQVLKQGQMTQRDRRGLG